VTVRGPRMGDRERISRGTASRGSSWRRRNYCRDYALLLCSLLRATGTPARVRGGYGTYFVAGLQDDHWVTDVVPGPLALQPMENQAPYQSGELARIPAPGTRSTRSAAHWCARLLGMRYIIIGAGAVGGTIGGRPAQAGREVVLVARGKQHAALSEGGLRLRGAGR
jgi:transglutaminase-like putative cysteine protease